MAVCLNFDSRTIHIRHWDIPRARGLHYFIASFFTLYLNRFFAGWKQLRRERRGKWNRVPIFWLPLNKSARPPSNLIFPPLSQLSIRMCQKYISVTFWNFNPGACRANLNFLSFFFLWFFNKLFICISLVLGSNWTKNIRNVYVFALRITIAVIQVRNRKKKKKKLTRILNSPVFFFIYPLFIFWPETKFCPGAWGFLSFVADSQPQKSSKCQRAACRDGLRHEIADSCEIQTMHTYVVHGNQ